MGSPSATSVSAPCTPVATSPCENSCREWCQFEATNCRLASLAPATILRDLVEEIEWNCRVILDIQSLPTLPPPEGIYGSYVQPLSTDLYSLSTKITRVGGLVGYYRLEPPCSPSFQLLKRKQARNEETSEVEKQWTEVWPKIANSGFYVDQFKA